MEICRACREPLESSEAMWCQSCKISWDRERAQDTIKTFSQLCSSAETDDPRSVPEGFIEDCRGEINRAYFILDVLS